MGFSSTDYSAALAEAIAYVQAPGRDVIVVAAVGNDAGSTPTYPAGMAGVIGVAATDTSGSITSFSNTGSAIVAAPGVNIFTTQSGGGYMTSTGTSAAAAEVAGLADTVEAPFLLAIITASDGAKREGEN